MRGPRRRGQVLILTLIAMSLLVSLVFFAYNVGDKVNRRLEMQGAADSIAITGAGWMARNMNVVAMNNVGEAKMLSLVPILDTQPQAARLSYNETKAWEEGLAVIVQQPTIDSQASAQLQQYLRDGTESLRKRMAEQRDILEPYYRAISSPGFDMEKITFWAKSGIGGAPPHGQLWRAAVTMEDFSHAAVETAGTLAQKRAIQMGKADSATAAFLTPVKPEMPARNGEYRDFRYPIRGYCKVFNEGAQLDVVVPGTNLPGKGGAIPDMVYPHRLGPWARLHRWRDYESTFIKTGQKFVPGREGTGKTTGGKSPYDGQYIVGRSARQRSDNGRPDGWQDTGYSELNSYTTFGPYEWAKRHIDWWARGTQREPGKLRDTRYYDYIDLIGAIKLEYLFGVGEAMPTREIHAPNWLVDYPQCKAIGEDGANSVAFTRWYVVEIASKFPEQSGSFMTPGTFRTNGDYPIAWNPPGWMDVANWPPPQTPKQVANYVWKDDHNYDPFWTTKDDQLGIQEERIPPGDPQGELVWHKVYFYSWYIFGGADIGGTEEVANPCNWDQFDALPKPILLDTSTGDYGGDDPDVAWRREKFMFLGVARKSMDAPIWPQRFSDANPLNGTMTIAQAKLFNNKSFDLWTQDWRVSLAPVTRVVPGSDNQSWAARLEAGVADAQSTDSVPSDEVETAYQYLSSLDSDMARLYMSH